MKSRDVIKRLLSYIERYSAFMALSFLMAALSVVSTLYAPVLTGEAIDKIISEGNVDFNGISDILLKLFMTIAITCVSQLVMNLINNEITYRVVRDIRVDAYNHLNSLPLSYIDSHKHGDVVSRLVSDIDTLADGLLMGFTQLFTGALTILGTLFFMLRINVPIALVVVFLTPLSLFAAAFIAKRTHSLFVKQAETRGELTSLVDEMVGEVKLVQAFSYEEEANERFAKINEALEKDSMKATFYSSLTNPVTRFVNGLCYTAVGVIGALKAVNGGGISVGMLTAFLSYANQYTKPFNEISNVITELQNAIACAGRVFELKNEETEKIYEGEEDIEVKDGDISLENVRFSYDKSRELIKCLNLDVKKGMKVAIVGPTGCGKSTLINLLMRFYDVDGGSIALSDRDIRTISRSSLRHGFGMVLQETWLKTGTVKENIAYGKPDATDEEIIAAAKAAHAHSFIKRLSQGYDTFLAEDGGALSQGEKQLLCIARLFLNIPPMLILDEATSSIDTRTEIRIQKAFHKLMEGRTSFIVAHRLSTIRESDIILVMKDGDIIEQGSHEELKKKGGFYAELLAASV
ncbi:MAG: ABC transporter ATP-binding protein [Lachnospiraceae bacterium]|nr:ABC transporter ATP-binding protein [Lachnospiraceae bacterium]